MFTTWVQVSFMIELSTFGMFHHNVVGLYKVKPVTLFKICLMNIRPICAVWSWIRRTGFVLDGGVTLNHLYDSSKLSLSICIESNDVCNHLSSDRKLLSSSHSFTRVGLLRRLHVFMLVSRFIHRSWFYWRFFFCLCAGCIYIYWIVVVMANEDHACNPPITWIR